LEIFHITNCASNKQKSYKNMIMSMFAVQVKEKPEEAAVKLSSD
jgi:hypothetical protein